jgi:hypothetical protein
LAIISAKVKDRSNNPQFVKKVEQAKALVRKRLLPGHLKNKIATDIKGWNYFRFFFHCPFQYREVTPLLQLLIL